MGDKSAHINQAHHNERFIQFLGIDTPLYRDWVISAIYYTAVNYIEAFIYEKIPGQHSDQVARTRQLSSPHQAREKIISDNFPSTIKRHYKTLKNASENVRYAKVDFKKYYKVPAIQKFYNTDLHSIKRFINY